MDKGKIDIGRALVAGLLGGAKPAAPLESLILAISEGYALGRNPDNWLDSVMAAIGELDSALEISEERAAVISRQAMSIRSLTAEREEMESRYRAESLECNRLRERNANQAVSINTYREQRDSEGKRAAAAEMSLSEYRADAAATFGALHSQIGELEGKADKARRDANRIAADSARFQRLAMAVGACTLDSLPAKLSAAYSACCDAGAALNAAERGE